MDENKFKVIGNNEGYMKTLHICNTLKQAEELLKYEQKNGKHIYFIVPPKKEAE